MDDEGFIFLVDRKKDVIITGGENIYPVEVEDSLHNHIKIYDVAVIGIPDDRLGEIAIAIIDPKPGETITEIEVIDFCKGCLARHKVPRKVIFDKVPRNPTGKIEKPKLREKYSKGHQSSGL
jgi:acyl-CoA synthetase (AMP-forming)/AMP-acid ligase II